MFSVKNKRFLTYFLIFFQNANSQGALTEKKYNTLSTYDGLKTAFNEYQLTKPLTASEHFQSMLRDVGAKCRWPRRVLVRPKPHQVSVKYYPHCTWLYRCSDDFGCCQSEDETCQPKEEVTVELPFYVSVDIVLNTSNSL